MAEPIAAAARRALPPFRLGQKQVYLPAHVITFLRRPEQSPNFATFEVPLRFTKFDIRDYLYNLYGVTTTAVRSSVKQSPVERKKNGVGAAFRPPARKFMTVELTRPFVWPEVPEDKEPWNHRLFKARQQAQEQQQEDTQRQQQGKLKYPSEEKPSTERRALRERAEKLLKGEATWETDAKLDEKWRGKSA